MAKVTIYLKNNKLNQYLETETVSYERARTRLAFWESLGRSAYGILEPSTIKYELLTS